MTASEGAGLARAHLARALGAQVVAELRSRLRAPGTIFTVLALFAAAFAYLPPPGTHQASILWDVNGELHSGEYSAGFIGAVVALVGGMMLPLVGFYLTTGSVKRDIDRRVWSILAATPTPRSAYLLGKWLASFTYLLVLASLALVPAVVTFVRFGVGPFDGVQLLLPWLLVAPAGAAFTAAMALLFDVTPGLRGRGGLVLFFFVWMFGFMLIPAVLGNMLDHDQSNDRLTSFDPSGLVLFESMIDRAMHVGTDGVSLGIIVTDKPIIREPFPALHPTAAMVATRVGTFAWSAVPLGLAMLTFPIGARAATRAPRRRRMEAGAEPAAATATAGAAAGLAAESHAPTIQPRPHAGHPGFVRSVLAETRLIWTTASWLRWPLLASSLLAFVVPTSGLVLPAAAFLLLVGPVIAETAAREQLAGAGPLVFSQPGVPRSAALWKLAAVALFVFALGAPLLLRSVLRGGAYGLAMLLALVFVSATAVGLGWLTGGGKLFLGAYTALWYLAIQRDSPFDFTGAFGNQPSLMLCAGFAAFGVAATLASALVERARR